MLEKKTKDIKVSIIIPVYNVVKYLEECLNSVLSQSFESFEIICVNDVSTDNSLAILEKYKKEYQNIKIVNHEYNRGLSAARNTGLDIAQGKYVLFLDSDDMIAPCALKELFQYAEENQLDEVYFNMQFIFDDGLEKYIKPSEKKYVEYNDVCTGREMFYRFCKDNTYKIEAWRQFYRKDFLIDNNLKFYEGILHEDNLFSFLCAMKAKRVMNINRDYYVYRKRKNSIMSTMDKRRAESMYIVLVEIFKYWNSNCFDENANEAISDYFMNCFSAFEKYKNYCADFNINFGTVAERLVYKLLNENKDSDILSKEDLSLLSEAKEIIVYGAGKFAIETIKCLEAHNIKITAVAVSDKSVNAENICGFQVYEISQVQVDKQDAIVIIAVSKKFEDEIVQELKEKGFKKMVMIKAE